MARGSGGGLGLKALWRSNVYSHGPKQLGSGPAAQMSTPARTELAVAGGTGDKHESADLLARVRVYIGIVLLVLGMSLSIPSAQTADWLTVISYLSITAAGLCLIFTGSVRRQGIRDQRNHEAIHSELCRLTEQVKTIEIPRQDDVTGELAEYLAARDDLHRDQGGE